VRGEPAAVLEGLPGNGGRAERPRAMVGRNVSFASGEDPRAMAAAAAAVVHRGSRGREIRAILNEARGSISISSRAWGTSPNAS